MRGNRVFSGGTRTFWIWCLPSNARDEINSQNAQIAQSFEEQPTQELELLMSKQRWNFQEWHSQADTLNFFELLTMIMYYQKTTASFSSNWCAEKKGWSRPVTSKLVTTCTWNVANLNWSVLLSVNPRFQGFSMKKGMSNGFLIMSHRDCMSKWS